jgi:GTP cyclohydrolase I
VSKEKEFQPDDSEGNGYLKIDRYNSKQTEKLAVHYGGILKLIGEDPSREGLQKTPERVAKAMQYLVHGYDVDPVAILNSAKFSEEYKQMVIVKDIELYSTCSHHMLPFVGKAHVAYIPNGKLIGLSKLARIVEVFSRRLQLQEKLSSEVADSIMKYLQPLGVGVIIEAKHFCMCARGVNKQHSSMVTSALRGVFKDDQKVRDEFMTLVSQ